MKKVAVFGSTGSVGIQTLHVAKHLKDSIKISVLAAHSNIALLEEQARLFSPSLVIVYEKEKASILQKRLPHIPILSGKEGLKEGAGLEEVDFVMLAMSGTLGLIPAVEAIVKKKQIGLANKEILVSAGAFITSLAEKKGVEILPVDSEHNALFQCLKGEETKEVRRLILTASGGPFRDWQESQFSSITPSQALAHPTYKMGAKLTIDSSTLMNKGLEMIEAHWLFNLPASQIEVVIHPESIVHSMVEFTDSSIIAMLSEPNMELPIQYALTYPNRKKGTLPPFDFSKQRSLHFSPPNTKRFPCLSLAYQALKEGKSMACFMNAANEVLVQRFLQQEFTWEQIAIKLEKLMSSHELENLLDLDSIFAVDQQARKQALLL